MTAIELVIEVYVWGCALATIALYTLDRRASRRPWLLLGMVLIWPLELAAVAYRLIRGRPAFDSRESPTPEGPRHAR